MTTRGPLRCARVGCRRGAQTTVEWGTPRELSLCDAHLAEYVRDWERSVAMAQQASTVCLQATSCAANAVTYQGAV